MPDTHHIGPYVVRTGPDWSIVRLPCGRMIRARTNADSAASAEALGYGDRVGEMCRDHDLLHCRLVDALGIPSNSLRLAAGLSHDAHLAALEEQAVCAISRLGTAAGAL